MNKSLFYLITFIFLAPFTFALVLQPTTLEITNTSQSFQLYVSEPVMFTTNCDKWFSFDERDKILEFKFDSAIHYNSCELYFASKQGIEMIKISPKLSDGIASANQNHAIDVEKKSVVTEEDLIESVSGELLNISESPKKPSTLAQFIGGINYPNINQSTIGGILIVLLFVSIVFLILPKN